DLLILKTLQMGSTHGWDIAQRIQQVSGDVLRVGQGSLYPALHRLEDRGWIAAEWGASENNRRAQYYRLNALRRVRRRLRALFRRAELEHELDDELAFHLEREIAQHVARGLDPAAARRE